MKKIVNLLIAVVSIMLVVSCSAYSLPPVTDGLVGCWTFDEGSGVTIDRSRPDGEVRGIPLDQSTTLLVLISLVPL